MKYLGGHLVAAMLGALVAAGAWRTTHPDRGAAPPAQGGRIVPDDLAPAPTAERLEPGESARPTPIVRAVVEAPDAAAIQKTSQEPHEFTTAEIRDAIDARFYAEGTDRNWRRESESWIQSRVEQSLPNGSHLVAIECRSSICRVETSHKDKDTYRKFARDSLARADFGWKGPGMVTDSDRQCRRSGKRGLLG